QSFTNYPLFHFTDVDPSATATNYTATIIWGDGQTSTVTASAGGQIVADPNGGFDVLGSHRYDTAISSAAFSVSVVDGFGVSTSRNGTVTVTPIYDSGSSNPSQSFMEAVSGPLPTDPATGNPVVTISATSQSVADSFASLFAASNTAPPTPPAGTSVEV